jgi:predicted 3-demethylubiquinone-9 3-methyltransferase (glyoxalase superfamily)
LGDVLTVEFTVLGIPCLGLNGGPAFRHTEAFSFQIATENQEETDRYWNAIVGNGGTESQCGWCKDRRLDSHREPGEQRLLCYPER